MQHPGPAGLCVTAWATTWKGRAAFTSHRAQVMISWYIIMLQGLPCTSQTHATCSLKSFEVVCPSCLLMKGACACCTGTHNHYPVSFGCEWSAGPHCPMYCSRWGRALQEPPTQDHPRLLSGRATCQLPTLPLSPPPLPLPKPSQEHLRAHPHCPRKISKIVKVGVKQLC